MAEIGVAIPVTIPTPSVTAGPLWAQEVSDFLTEVNDGFAAGVRSSIGLTIDANLPVGHFQLTEVGGVLFTPVAAPIGLTNAAYVRTGGELHYIDEAGNDVQITSGGAINAASLGGINGDYGVGNQADVSYVDATSSFVFTQDPGVSSKLDTGDILLRQTIASALAVTVKSPASLASAYSMTLPTATPASTSLLQWSSAGVMSSTRAPSVDSVTASGTILGVTVQASVLAVTGISGFTGNAQFAGDLTLVTANKTVSAPRLETAEGNVRHGTKRVLLGAISGKQGTTDLGNTVVAAGSLISSAATKAYFDLVVPSVGTLTAVLFRVASSAGTKPTLKLWSIAALTGAATQVGTTQTATTTGNEDLSLTGLTSTISASFRYTVEVGLNAASQAILTGYFEYTNP